MAQAEQTQLTNQEILLVEALKHEVAEILEEHPVLRAFCTRQTYVRFLQARQWCLHKASKMLNATLEWRLQYKPHLIRFDDIKAESLTGKNQVYPTLDRHGRPVLLMRPRFQNSKDMDGDVKFLVYLMEQATKKASDSGAHKMTWLIDFQGYTAGQQIPIRQLMHVNDILQSHYPECLGAAVCYHAPFFFSLTWRALKPFMDPRTQRKIVFADKGKEHKVMDPLFHMDKMEQCLGGDIPGYVFSMEQFEKDCRAFDSEVEEELRRVAAATHQDDSCEASIAGSTDMEVLITTKRMKALALL